MLYCEAWGGRSSVGRRGRFWLAAGTELPEIGVSLPARGTSTNARSWPVHNNPPLQWLRNQDEVGT
jgi:hypothetical protein